MEWKKTKINKILKKNSDRKNNQKINLKFKDAQKRLKIK